MILIKRNEKGMSVKKGGNVKLFLNCFSSRPLKIGTVAHSRQKMSLVLQLKGLQTQSNQNI